MTGRKEWLTECSLCGQGYRKGLGMVCGGGFDKPNLCEFCLRILLKKASMGRFHEEAGASCAYCGSRSGLLKGPAGSRHLVCETCARQFQAILDLRGPDPGPLELGPTQGRLPAFWFDQDGPGHDGSLPGAAASDPKPGGRVRCCVCGYELGVSAKLPFDRFRLALCTHCVDTAVILLSRSDPPPKAGGACLQCGRGEGEGSPLLTFPGKAGLTFCLDCLRGFQDAMATALGRLDGAEGPAQAHGHDGHRLGLGQETGHNQGVQGRAPDGPRMGPDPGPRAPLSLVPAPRRWDGYSRRTLVRGRHYKLTLARGKDPCGGQDTCPFCKRRVATVRPAGEPSRLRARREPWRICPECLLAFDRLLKGKGPTLPASMDGACCFICGRPVKAGRKAVLGPFPERLVLCQGCVGAFSFLVGRSEGGSGS
ncbi:MAG: hypothetical protein LBF40_07905 [Deltaproteobacteria bacterium]|jgi:hypothetical protein|nr:hypothetical protein [Deltaproteobacteria bacterium]